MRPVARLLPASPRVRSRFGRDVFALLRSAMALSASSPDSSLHSVSELLRRRAGERPNQAAFVFVSQGDEQAGVEEVAWSYGELDRRAQAIAAALGRHAQIGDRAVLVFQPGLEFIAAFFGCLYAGVAPVPATYPKPRRRSSRLDAIVADCTPRVALTTADTRSILCLDDQSAAVRELIWLAVDECTSPSQPYTPVTRTPEDVAFLQYTSGSTSQPRGVVVSHGNLLHNLELIRGGFGIPAAESGEPAPASVFWLPAYHDMGLIGGILEPIYVGGTTHLLAPATFLQRPLSWLETISRTGATFSGAPNFAFDLCTKKVTPQQRANLDLSKWKLAFCGAEPIDVGTLNAFATEFAITGFCSSAFYPCYGLAESTLLVTGGQGPGEVRVLNADRQQLSANRLIDAGTSATNAQPLVSNGRPLGGQDVRIVDPRTSKPLADGAIGEIWVKGGSVASGYWNHPEEYGHTFGARLAEGSGPFLRTGDLGAFRSGELYVTGRVKDVIIIRGRNLYPQDIERTAQQAHEAVDLGAAFSLSKDGHEQLVLVHQVHREHRRGDLGPVIRAIRSAIVEEHEVDPQAIVLLRPGALPLTSSGKVQRSRCRELFEAGTLDALDRWEYVPERSTMNGQCQTSAATRGKKTRPEFLDQLSSYSTQDLAAEVQQWMLEWLSTRVEAAGTELTPTAAFTELGMDSLTALELNVEFENVLGVRLPPVAASSYPTPAALSQYLAEMLLGQTPSGRAEPTAPVDSWFAEMEADARRR